jgi:hypothetical protein
MMTRLGFFKLVEGIYEVAMPSKAARSRIYKAASIVNTTKSQPDDDGFLCAELTLSTMSVSKAKAFRSILIAHR